MFEAIKLKFASGAQRLGREPARLRRFARQQDGAAAVEFALVAAPFLALIFAIMETAIVFFSGQALETAVADASRLIMTGQAQTQGLSQTAFKNAVCAQIYGLFDCQNGVYVDVKTFSSFTNVTMPSPVDSQGNFQNNFTYNPAAPATSWWCGCSINGRSMSRCSAQSQQHDRRQAPPGRDRRVPQRALCQLSATP